MIKNIIKYWRKRINCNHPHFEQINCYHTGVFMFYKCTECGKKKDFL